VVDSYHVSTICKNDLGSCVTWSSLLWAVRLFTPGATGPGSLSTAGLAGTGRALTPLITAAPRWAHSHQAAVCVLVFVDLDRGDITWKVPFSEGSGPSASIRCSKA
jgi:hypothetical protein